MISHFLAPHTPLPCSGKKVKLATINLGTVGMAPPAVPKEMKAAMNIAKQVRQSDAKAAKGEGKGG